MTMNKLSTSEQIMTRVCLDRVSWSGKMLVAAQADLPRMTPKMRDAFRKAADAIGVLTNALEFHRGMGPG